MSLIKQIFMSRLIRTRLAPLFHFLLTVFSTVLDSSATMLGLDSVGYLQLSPVDGCSRQHTAGHDQVEVGTTDLTQGEDTDHKTVLRLRGVFRRGEPVILNVYDLYWVTTTGAEYTLNTQHKGVFHSGIEVYSREFAFGGHPFPYSGIYEISPRQHFEYGGQSEFKFKRSIHLGYTDYNEEEIIHIVKELGQEWRGDCYHVMNKNCNNFTETIVWILIGKNEIPTWVNRVAYVLSCYPILPNMFSSIYKFIYK